MIGRRLTTARSMRRKSARRRFPVLLREGLGGLSQVSLFAPVKPILTPDELEGAA